MVLGLARGVGAEPVDSLRLTGAEATSSQRVVSEEVWAAELARILGLERVLPPEPVPTDVYALLCADHAERTLGAGGRELPEDAPFRIAFEPERPRGPERPVRAVLRVPATTLYQLSVEGVGFQRWVIDGRPVEHLDLSPLGVAQAAAIVPLRAGPHELSGYLAGGARVDRVELSAYRPLCVAPADGWHGARALRHGALARTLVRTFDLDRRLPELEDEELRIEAESFAGVSAGGGRTNRRLRMAASGGGWAEAVSSPAEFSWSFHLEEPRVVSIRARTHGVLPQLWSVDGRYRITLEPRSLEGGFDWNHVVTLPLAAGRHALRALVARGSGVDEIRVMPHRSADADYTRLVAELGFAAGAPGEPVSRGEVRELLASSSFAQLAKGFRWRMAGDLRDRSLVLVDAEPAPYTSRPLTPLLPAEL
jgi:hypothetical protein